jgi:hypothetical protein
VSSTSLASIPVIKARSKMFSASIPCSVPSYTVILLFFEVEKIGKYWERI